MAEAVISSDMLRAGIRHLVRQGFLSGFVTALVDEVGLSKPDAEARVARFARELPNEQIDAVISVITDPSTPRLQIFEVGGE